MATDLERDGHGPRDGAEQAPGPTTDRIRRAQDGNLDALSKVIEEMSPALVALLRERFGSRIRSIDVDDLVQDAWLVSLRRLGDLRPRHGRLGPVLFRFLKTTVLHRALDMSRSREAATAQSRRRPVGHPSALDARCAAPDPDDFEVRERLLEVMTGLGEADRAVLRARILDRISNKRAALRLGVTPNTLAKRYQRLCASLCETSFSH